MTDGEGKGHSLCRACLSFSVILVASTGIQSCPMPVFLPPSRWRQSRKKPNGYAAPNRRETRPFSSPLPSFSRLSFFVRHSHALPGNPVPNCEQQDWIPAFGENDGRGGMARMTPKTGFPPSVRMTAGRAMVIPCVARVFLFPSFSWPPRESSPRPHCIVLRRHSPAPPGNPVLQWERTRLDSHLR